MTGEKELHKIVIVGGGAAGLELASSLGRKLGRKKKAEITLVEASYTHIWKPLLHEVAAGSFAETDEIEYLAQAHRCHFQFRLGRMEGLDRDRKEIFVSPTITKNGDEIIPKRVFNYDTLVISVGSVSNIFNVAGVNEHCLFLDTPYQAYRFQKRLVERYITTHTKAQSKNKCLSIAIIGAGATGVELSAELLDVKKQFSMYGLDDITVKVTIIDTANRLLPALSEKLAFAVHKQLHKLGVELKLGQQVVGVTEKGVRLKDGDIVLADIKVWAAGIKGPDWLANLDGLEVNRINQLVVKQTLESTEDGDIFAMGDCAACPWPGHDRPVPPRAQAAHQQASTLEKTLINRVQGSDETIDYIYRDYGSLVALGRHSTVGSLMGNLMGSVSVGGFVARLVYLSLYKMHQVAIHGYFRTAMLTLSNLFRRSTHARIKMH
ncbi:MAG: NAD(P)/FAD-dependent oxidoreductase [Methylococcales bacterium]|jgi:NADH dehydrogenase|nr:NAD(P)/FAD-dependent oxidoreductase [Methylococcales bacterium]MBT6523556.1 NAD(P)/FAD-dependent oxidoreductase [Methylococcales bacterium]